ncbi:glycoside hydrolase family 53 protein [Mesohalobacter halotolerans]|uniref:Arabinogalactan endo-beta-1,4-galactanase n=1 Tax=Mesohalobacter halotolerans TaxID=1883405 RepID=A0A4U5TSH1_9FLAO|nr:glycosyl hydrolase 53 family protein [Mesohalobacter halotolerans]MBS3738610.1 glycosyl hydrolase 53 family protein [Psychroflexus sp.]TKS57267.1 arabinogalactan endo-1,4-beta-galactosidase [Mesohalobacter halotolerans]
MFKSILFLGWTFFTISLLSSCSDVSDEISPNDSDLNTPFFMKGMDMSLLPEVRNSGVLIYNNSGQVQDMLDIVKSEGVNTIRLRLWHQPESSTSSFQTVKTLSQEIRSLGLKLLLTVHYSDTWADPGSQEKPQAWQGLNQNQLKDSLSQYTSKIIREIQPNIIQIGNEINHGFLWPEAHINNETVFLNFLSEAIQAVRSENEQTQIMLHYAGHENADVFFNSLEGLDYDLIGISYYPRWHGKSLSRLRQNLISLNLIQNKPVAIVETAYPFTLDFNDFTNNIIGNEDQILDNFPPSPQGQKDYFWEIKSIAQDIPEAYGFCSWGSEWISFRGDQATDGSPYENQAFWDFDNQPLPVFSVYKSEDF